MSSGSEPATDASVLLASRPILTSKQSDSLFPGGFYVNVNNADAFLISMIYSKASITFICLIGMLTAFNTLIFSAEVHLTLSFFFDPIIRCRKFLHKCDRILGIRDEFAMSLQ